MSPRIRRSELDALFARLGAPMLLLVALAASLRPGLENDAWWHMAAGRWMLEERAWLTVDVFSWTMLGEPWQRPGLVADIAMAALHEVGGVRALASMAAACFVAAVGIVLASVRASATPTFMVGLLAVMVMVGAATPRPLVVSLPLTAACIFVLERERWALNGSRWLWALPVLAALWVNIHGAFIMLFVLIGSYGLGALFDGLRHRADGCKRRVFRLGGAGTLAMAAVTVNPFGASMLLYPLETLQLGVLAETVDEWRRPAFSDPQSWPLLLLVGLACAVLLRPRRARTTTDLLLLVVMGGLALSAVRHGPLFAIVALPVLARLLSGEKDAPPVPVAWSAATRRERWVEGALLVMVAGAVAVLVMPALTEAGNRAAIDERHGDRAVERAAAGDLPGRLWNSYDLGGHVIWIGTPDVLVSIDSRTDLHGDAAVREHVAEWHGERDSPARFERAGIQAVLVERHAPLVDQLEAAGWQQVEADAVAVVLRAP